MGPQKTQRHHDLPLGSTSALKAFLSSCVTGKVGLRDIFLRHIGLCRNPLETILERPVSSSRALALLRFFTWAGSTRYRGCCYTSAHPWLRLTAKSLFRFRCARRLPTPSRGRLPK